MNKTRHWLGFDVQALFTNVPIQSAIEAIKKAVNEMPQDSLPVPKQDLFQLIQLCLEFGSFTFNDPEYLQHQCLAMGSPLSPVGACPYMEMHL